MCKCFLPGDVEGSSDFDVGTQRRGGVLAAVSRGEADLEVEAEFDISHRFVPSRRASHCPNRRCC